jgi:hypothetical protein
MLVWTITSYFTCPSSSDTINLTIGHPAPEITSNAPLCEGSTMILTIVDPSPFTTFNWFDPNNNLVGTSSTLTIPNVTPSMQGVYTVYLTDEYGCEISASKGVEILQTDDADAGLDQLICTETHLQSQRQYTKFWKRHVECNFRNRNFCGCNRSKYPNF